MDFYQRLLSHKTLMKLSWKQMGDIVNKGEAAIRVAVNRKSLNKLEIEKFEQIFFSNNEDGLKNKIVKIGAHQVLVDEYMAAFVENYKDGLHFENHPSFKIIINNIKKEGIIEYLTKDKTKE